MKAVYIETKAVNKGHYVPGMISGGVLYVSGQLPMNHETGIMENGDLAAQARMALHNVDLVLSAAGTTKDRVAMCRVYIPDMALWDEVNDIYAEFFGDHKPARVVVPTRNLHHGVLIEIEATAEMPEQDS
jgi:reactive intermediate/imine deaminase